MRWRANFLELALTGDGRRRRSGHASVPTHFLYHDHRYFESRCRSSGRRVVSSGLVYMVRARQSSNREMWRRAMGRSIRGAEAWTGLRESEPALRGRPTLGMPILLD